MCWFCARTRTHTNIHKHAHTHTNTQTHTRTHTHIRTHTHTYAHTHIPSRSLHTQTHTHTHPYSDTHAHTHTTDRHTQRHDGHTHTHTQTHTHTGNVHTCRKHRSCREHTGNPTDRMQAGARRHPKRRPKLHPPPGFQAHHTLTEYCPKCDRKYGPQFTLPLTHKHARTWDIYLGFGAPVIVIRDGYNFDSCGDFDSWLPNSIRDRDP